MGPLGRWTVLIVAGGVLAIAWAFQVLAPHEIIPKDPLEVTTRLWTTDLRRIESVAISRPDDGLFGKWVLRDGEWLEDRNGGRTMPAEIWSGVPLLLSRPEVSLLTETPSSLAMFGLDRPQLIVEALAGGRRLVALIGQRVPDGTGYYVKLPEGSAVYTIDYSWFDVMQDVLETWKDVANESLGA